MSSGISFTMITAPFTEAAADMAKLQDKATMFALRSTGRYIGRAAKAKAPVYHGTDPRATAESGNLKKSIRNSKRLTSAGGSYSMKVGPFGTKKAGTAVTRHGSGKGQLRGVQMYRDKQELTYGYMAAGLAAVDSGAKEIFESAYAKAFARYSA